eukprot:749187-Hanusia_phi.AAC.4
MLGSDVRQTRVGCGRSVRGASGGGSDRQQAPRRHRINRSTMRAARGAGAGGFKEKEKEHVRRVYVDEARLSSSRCQGSESSLLRLLEPDEAWILLERAVAAEAEEVGEPVLELPPPDQSLHGLEASVPLLLLLPLLQLLQRCVVGLQ